MQDAVVEVVAPKEKAPLNADAYAPEALKEVVEQNRAEQAEEVQFRRGNRKAQRNFKRLWRAVQEGAGYGNGSIHKYTKHQPTRAEIKARRKHGRR